MNKKPSGRAASIPIGLLYGLGVSLGLSLLLALVSAKMVDMRWIGERDIGYCAMVILMVSSFCGTRMAQFCVKRQLLLVGSLSGCLYFVALLGITLLFFGGQFEAVGVTFILILCGMGLTMVTGSRKNRVGKHKKKLHKL